MREPISRQDQEVRIYGVVEGGCMMHETTNRDRPFEPGERIEFCDEVYEVLENHGRTGWVREYPNGATISGFYWEFQGEVCRRVVRETQ